jgi:hypothetical protein
MIDDDGFHISPFSDRGGGDQKQNRARREPGAAWFGAPSAI